MPDYASAGTGALSGASTGFSIGGVPGAVAGGLIGGASGLFGKKKKKKLSAFDKYQQQLHEQQFQALQGEGPLADLYNYDPEQANQVFDKTIARKAQRNFAEGTVPSITGAFRSQGLQNSSYAGDALSKAGRDVQENLDALRAQYLSEGQSEARSAKRGALNEYQNRQTFAYDKGTQPFDISKVLDSISPELKETLGDYFKNKDMPKG